MGKKSKKKSNTSNKKGGSSGSSSSGHPRHHDHHHHPKLNSDQKSLYAIYKYCTEAVIEWASSAYRKLQQQPNGTKTGASNNNNKKKQPSSFTLSYVIFENLTSLAMAGIAMPTSIIQDLRTTIHYRKRVGAYYKSVPTASEEDHARHEWLIAQLERMEAIFSAIPSERQDMEEEGKLKQDQDTAAKLNRFEALQIGENEEDGHEEQQQLEEEEEEEETEENNYNNKEAQQQPSPSFVPPTLEELESEERSFAISLVLCEIAEIRTDLQNIWNNWAIVMSESSSSDSSTRNNDTGAASSLPSSSSTSSTTTNTTNTKAGETLFAATACTEYAIAAVRKLILQTSVAFQDFEDFDQILQSFEMTNTFLDNQMNPEQLMIDDCVTLRHLSKRPDLNGRHGRIINYQENENRYGVQIFPQDAYASPDPKLVLSIKPENLILSDNAVLRLGQIHTAMKAFQKESIPQPPELMYGSPPSPSVQGSTITMMMKYDQFTTALNNRDFASFLHLTVEYAIPIWISLTRYLPFKGAADAVLHAYLRDYDETGVISFHLAFAILVAMDTAFSFRLAGDDDPADKAKELFCNVLHDCFNGSLYSIAIDIHDKKGLRPDAFYSHFEFARHFREEYNEMCRFYPYLSGEFLLQGLRLHFVCGSGFPYQFCQQYTTLLHIYWMLRYEGCLGRLPEIEKTLIRMYRQSVWFHGGIPRKGQEAYLKYWQLAIGATLHAAKLIDGRQTARPGRECKELSRDGLFVTEISRLLDILQWKTMPILNRNKCFDEIQAIAREEYTSIFTAPLLRVCTKLCHLEKILASNFASMARASGHQMVANFAMLTRGLTDLSVVSFWGLSLGDDRSLVPGEKGMGLTRLANSFRGGFAEEPLDDGPPSLSFSPYDHKVDPSLWGEKGVFREEHLQT
jgi:hypothetical protein